MSIRTTVMLCWVAVFWGGVLIGTIHSVSLNGNGYEFTVAISEDALQLDAEQRVPFLDALKVSFIYFIHLASFKLHSFVLIHLSKKKCFYYDLCFLVN
jgi:hypothetical protein